MCAEIIFSGSHQLCLQLLDLYYSACDLWYKLIQANTSYLLLMRDFVQLRSLLLQDSTVVVYFLTTLM